MIIALSFTVITDIKTNDLKTVIDNKEQIDKNIETAIDDGVARLAVLDDNNNVIINKDAAVQSFFASFQSSFGVLDDTDNKDKLNMYIPLVLIAMEDGYYIFYCDEYKDAGNKTYIAKRWTEKFPYYYEDEDFIYGFTQGDIVKLYDKNSLLNSSGTRNTYEIDYHDLQKKDEFSYFRSQRPANVMLNDDKYEQIRKNTIIDCIEYSMAYYTSRHNKIAEQYGIAYNFSLPVIDGREWETYIDDISMYVVFQGYPYGTEPGETYNRIASAGAKVSKKDVFYLQQKDWYYVYHRSSCPELVKGGIILKDEPYYREQDCAAEGAYACPVCSQTGAFAPDYKVDLEAY